MNHKGVCRTAPATVGLLTICDSQTDRPWDTQTNTHTYRQTYRNWNLCSGPTKMTCKICAFIPCMFNLYSFPGSYTHKLSALKIRQQFGGQMIGVKSSISIRRLVRTHRIWCQCIQYRLVRGPNSLNFFCNAIYIYK